MEYGNQIIDFESVYVISQNMKKINIISLTFYLHLEYLQWKILLVYWFIWNNKNSNIGGNIVCFYIMCVLFTKSKTLPYFCFI